MEQFDDRDLSIQTPVQVEVRNVPGTTKRLLLLKKSKFQLGWIKKNDWMLEEGWRQEVDGPISHCGIKTIL
jgi:hypothetical protein